MRIGADWYGLVRQSLDYGALHSPTVVLSNYYTGRYHCVDWLLCCYTRERVQRQWTMSTLYITVFYWIFSRTLLRYVRLMTWTVCHSVSVITNFVIPKRDKQTDRQKTSHFFVYSRRATHDPHHTWHGDREGPHHFCTPNFFDPISSFAARGYWKFGSKNCVIYNS